MLRGFSLKIIPVNVLQVTIRRNGSLPAAIGFISEHLSVDGGNHSHAVLLPQFGNWTKARSADRLDPDLHDPIRSFDGLPHSPGVVGIKGHGLFLVNVFAGLNCGNEIEYVLVLRCGEEHGVHVFLVQQFAKIQIRFYVGSNLLRFIQPPRIHVGYFYYFATNALHAALRIFRPRLPLPINPTWTRSLAPSTRLEGNIPYAAATAIPPITCFTQARRVLISLPSHSLLNMMLKNSVAAALCCHLVRQISSNWRGKPAATMPDLAASRFRIVTSKR